MKTTLAVVATLAFSNAQTEVCSAYCDTILLLWVIHLISGSFFFLDAVVTFTFQLNFYN